jgi:hypothetical protein
VPALESVSRCLGRPVERSGHFEDEILPAGEGEQLVVDLFANGAQMPIELGIALRDLAGGGPPDRSSGQRPEQQNRDPTLS